MESMTVIKQSKIYKLHQKIDQASVTHHTLNGTLPLNIKSKNNNFYIYRRRICLQREIFIYLFF